MEVGPRPARAPNPNPKPNPNPNQGLDLLELLLEAERVLVHGGLLVEGLLHGGREALVLLLEPRLLRRLLIAHRRRRAQLVDKPLVLVLGLLLLRGEGVHLLRELDAVHEPLLAELGEVDHRADVPPQPLRLGLDQVDHREVLDAHGVHQLLTAAGGVQG